MSLASICVARALAAFLRNGLVLMIFVTMAAILRKLLFCLPWGKKPAREASITQALNPGPGQEACIKSDREASAQSGLVCRKASRTGDGSSPPGELYEQARVGEHALSVDTTPARSAPPPATPSGSGAPAEPGNVTPVVRALHKVEEGDEDCGEEAEQPDGTPESLSFPATRALQSRNSSSSMRSFHPALKTPQPAAGAAHPAGTAITPIQATPVGGFKFLFENDSTPHVSGIPNTVHKYATDQPVRLRSTPYEQRIARTLDAEQQAIDRYKKRAQHTA